jgi:hypothetical protein
LEKCPDKNAKMTFTVEAYMKEEIQPDAVSLRSVNTPTNEMSMMGNSVMLQPDFKKKRQEP